MQKQMSQESAQVGSQTLESPILTRWTRYGNVWSDGPRTLTTPVMRELLEFTGQTGSLVDTEYWVLLPEIKH